MNTHTIASTLHSNKTPIGLGTIVTIWHGHRGHNYVIAGIDKKTRKIFLIKNNCINQDGTIHRATSGFHKVLNFNSLNNVKKVSTIVGVRTNLSVTELQKLNPSIADFGSITLYASTNVDRRSTALYS